MFKPEFCTNNIQCNQCQYRSCPMYRTPERCKIEVDCYNCEHICVYSENDNVINRSNKLSGVPLILNDKLGVITHIELQTSFENNSAVPRTFLDIMTDEFLMKHNHKSIVELFNLVLNNLYEIPESLIKYRIPRIEFSLSYDSDDVLKKIAIFTDKYIRLELENGHTYTVHSDIFIMDAIKTIFTLMRDNHHIEENEYIDVKIQSYIDDTITSTELSLDRVLGEESIRLNYFDEMSSFDTKLIYKLKDEQSDEFRIIKFKDLIDSYDVDDKAVYDLLNGKSVSIPKILNNEAFVKLSRQGAGPAIYRLTDLIGRTPVKLGKLFIDKEGHLHISIPINNNTARNISNSDPSKISSLLVVFLYHKLLVNHNHIKFNQNIFLAKPTIECRYMILSHKNNQSIIKKYTKPLIPPYESGIPVFMLIRDDYNYKDFRDRLVDIFKYNQSKGFEYKPIYPLTHLNIIKEDNGCNNLNNDELNKSVHVIENLLENEKDEYSQFHLKYVLKYIKDKIQ